MRDAVARLLSETVGAHIRDVVDLGNPVAPVLRVALDAEYDGIGRTVIAKLPRRTGAGWNGDPGYLDNERRAPEHLEQAGVTLTPRVLSSDGDLGVLMTDLGHGPSVQELLAATETARLEPRVFPALR